MPFATLPTDATLHYEDHNPSSPRIPIIALHGMLGTAHTHLSHVIDHLTHLGYRVIAPTMRGYGQSQPKPRDFPLRFYDRDADDVMALADFLHIKQCHIMGYSDGGEIALICGGKQPERFVSIASWGAVGYFGNDIRPVVQGMIPGSAWLTPAEMAIHGIISADNFARQWVRSITYMIDVGGDVSLSLASHIQAPLLMMLGYSDTLNPASYAQKFLAQVTNGHLEMFDCGHPIHDEQSDLFFEILDKHLLQIN